MNKQTKFTGNIYGNDWNWRTGLPPTNCVGWYSSSRAKLLASYRWFDGVSFSLYVDRCQSKIQANAFSTNPAKIYLELIQWLPQSKEYAAWLIENGMKPGVVEK